MCQLSNLKKDVLDGKTHKDIHAAYPLFKSQDIELLMKFVLEHKDCTEMELLEQILK